MEDINAVPEDSVENLGDVLSKYHRYNTLERETLWEIVEMGAGGRFRKVIREKDKKYNMIKNK